KTIREHLRKRCQLVLLIPATFMIGASAGISHLPWAFAIVVFLLLFSALLSLAFLALRMTRCPRCGARLGGAARAGGSGEPTVVNCPSCGGRIDESMPG